MSYNIYITHGWKENEEYNQLVSWIKNSEIADKVNIVSNYDKASAGEGATADDLRRALSDQIAEADCVIILGSLYATAAGWMDHQFLATKSLGKRIVLIKPTARVFAQNVTVPFPVQGSADVVLTWHEGSFINFLKMAVENH